VIRIWNSLEACTLDLLPIIGEVGDVEGYLLATGFSGHGFALAPSVGALLAEFILTGKTSIPLHQLSPQRFVGYDARQISEFLEEEASGASMGRLQ
jgi:sarcosine oxidase subunit beta